MSDLVGNPEDRFSHNEAHIMIFSEICEYLGSRLKVQTKITDFYSLSMPLCTRNEKSKIEFYDDFMIILYYYDIQRNFLISQLSVEGSN